MQWATQLSTALATGDALEEATAGVRAQLGSTAPTVAFVFASPHHRERADDLATLVGEALGTTMVFGCGDVGVIGGGRELERGPALTIVGAVMPACDVQGFALEPGTIPGVDATPERWWECTGIDPADVATLVLIADPRTAPSAYVIPGLERAYPDAVKLGGLGVGGDGERTPLFCGTQTQHGGLVGLALSGNVRVETIVAQGCRPVGTPMFVTRAEANVAFELDGRAPTRVLQEVYEAADGRDRELMRSSLFLGLASRPDREVYGLGDYLVRNLVGFDARTGALAVGAHMRVGTVVQFHVRDAQTSAADLEAHLRRHRERNTTAAGALMFSCVGRGIRLYGHPDHDVAAVREHATPRDLPVAGFFGHGEIGPVAGQTHLHGYTSVIGFFGRDHFD
jgi:small ligand-binding sensory domain FIST